MADDLTVMCSGAFARALRELVPGFERDSGSLVLVIEGPSLGTTSRAIPVRLRGGEMADLVILFDDIIDRLVDEGLVMRGSKVTLATSAIGVAVRSGAPRPDVSSSDALRAALLAAGSFAYSASASGVYVASELLAKLGLPEDVGGRGIQVRGEPVGAAVARGAAELGFQQMSELLPVAGIDVLGPLPAGVQQFSVLSAGVPVTAKNIEGARLLIAHVRSSDSLPALFSAGLGTPP